jgi:hypothetical protein
METGRNTITPQVLGPAPSAVAIIDRPGDHIEEEETPEARKERILDNIRELLRKQHPDFLVGMVVALRPEDAARPDESASPSDNITEIIQWLDCRPVTFCRGVLLELEEDLNPDAHRVDEFMAKVYAGGRKAQAPDEEAQPEAGESAPAWSCTAERILKLFRELPVEVRAWILIWTRLRQNLIDGESEEGEKLADKLYDQLMRDDSEAEGYVPDHLDMKWLESLRTTVDLFHPYRE